jgi:hypothetical protein
MSKHKDRKTDGAAKLPKDSAGQNPDSPNAGNSTRRPAVRKAVDPRKAPDQQARVHKNLEGFQIGINTFGEISSNFAVDRINAFLNKHVPDKRLTDAAAEGGTETPEPPAGS